MLLLQPFWHKGAQHDYEKQFDSSKQDYFLLIFWPMESQAFYAGVRIKTEVQHMAHGRTGSVGL